MKTIIFGLTLLYSLMSFSQSAEKPLIEEFHTDPVVSLGVGSSIMSGSNYGYVNAKAFLFRYGEIDTGVRFLGVGAVYSQSKGSFSVSPIAIHIKRIIFSVDVQKEDSFGAGFSLNYRF